MPARRICRAKGAGRKGVSTVVGMTIFMLLFAIAVAYIFIWSQNSGTYIDTVKKQVDFERSRLTENLIVSAKNLTSVMIENPTAQVIVVTQVWSNNSIIWQGERGISPFGSVEIVNDSATTGNGNFTVITYRGNIFSGGLRAQLDVATRRSWEVSWYWNDSVGSVAHTAWLPSNLVLSTKVGITYWYDLNLDYEWDYLNNPVIAKIYNMSDGTALGFVAKTTLIKLSDNSSDAWINFYNSSSSRIAISVDSPLPTNWDYQPEKITGAQYSLHDVYIYFDGYGKGDVDVRLNVVNATFAR
jgi:hypothetical protein